MSMRTKNENFNSWWDPHATSTPLKKIPNVLVKNKPPKHPVILSDSNDILKKLQNAHSNSDFLRDKSTGTKLSVSRRAKKSRLSAYFELSSSSEDEGEVKKRPIIKVNSKKNSKVLSKDKGPETEETLNSKSEKPDPIVSKTTLKTTETNKLSASTSKSGDNQPENKIVETKTNSCDDNNSADSDEENRILNYSTRSKNLKCCNKNKPGEVCVVKDDLHSKHPGDHSETEKKTIPRSRKATKTSKLTSSNNQDSQSLEINQKFSSENKKPRNYQKRKTKKALESVGPVKKRTRKAASTNIPTPPIKSVLSVVNSSVCKDKSNLSHQLFSESTEQEYINSLDLASEEVVEVEKKSSLPAGTNAVFEPFMWPYPSSHKVCNVSKAKTERPKRRQKAPREFWLPKPESPAVSKGVEPQKTSEKNKELIHEIDLLPNTEGKLNGVSNAKQNDHQNEGGKPKEIKSGIVIEKKTTIQDEIVNCESNQNTGNSAFNCSGLSKACNGLDKAETNENLKCKDGKQSVNSSIQSVFKKSEELTFPVNGTGCSVVQCWNITKLKCGVFKLKKKSHFTCKTLHGSSHFGGVLVKGNIRMRIGIEEQDLTEGDMAFVPPLTEWQMTNTGVCESLFYYWCGGFQS